MRELAPRAVAVLLLAAAAGGQSDERWAHGLPPDLILVPAGEVRIGRTAAQLESIADQLHRDQPERRRRALRQMLAELGPHRVSLPAFYLHRFEVTNEQYRLFVESTGHRFPFHWWKVGVPEDYQSRRSALRSEFSGRTRPELDYWETHWTDLPSAIPAGGAKHPVCFVSWLDAVPPGRGCGCRPRRSGCAPPRETATASSSPRTAGTRLGSTS